MSELMSAVSKYANEFIHANAALPLPSDVI